MRSVELSLINNNKANSLTLKSCHCPHMVSESRPPLARAAPDSKEVRLRWRFHADHCCTMEGNCAFILSILWRSSAATRCSVADNSLERVSRRATQGRGALRWQQKKFLLRILQARLHGSGFSKRCKMITSGAGRQRSCNFSEVELKCLHHVLHLPHVISFRHCVVQALHASHQVRNEATQSLETRMSKDGREWPMQ